MGRLAGIIFLIWLVVPLSARADAALDRQIIHVLNRIGAGPTEEVVAHIKAVGIDRYTDEQLNPDTLPEPAALTDRLAALDTQQLSASQLFVRYGPPPSETMEGAKPTQEAIDARMRRGDAILQQARAARIWRALYSPRQLQEVMVDFWFNHFNVFAGKGLDRAVGRQLSRTRRSGRMCSAGSATCCCATAQHPAMLFYLDNQANTAPGSPDARADVGRPQRELRPRADGAAHAGRRWRLHPGRCRTLARILTGWGFDRPELQHRRRLRPSASTRRATTRPRRCFSATDIPAGGGGEGIAALDMLAASPATAHHIAFELAQYFVADKPPPALVDRLAQRVLGRPTATSGRC